MRTCVLNPAGPSSNSGDWELILLSFLLQNSMLLWATRSASGIHPHHDRISLCVQSAPLCPISPSPPSPVVGFQSIPLSFDCVQSAPLCLIRPGRSAYTSRCFFVLLYGNVGVQWVPTAVFCVLLYESQPLCRISPLVSNQPLPPALVANQSKMDK